MYTGLLTAFNMKLVYNVSVYLYMVAVKILSVFNGKAKLWVDGRKNIFSRINKEDLSDKQIIWVHCASLGEFEQARPIIEQMRSNFPKYSIFLTFFSPSGYEIRKNYELADYVYYLPIDTAKNAQLFVELVNPKLVIFVKYEFWFNYILELNRQKIPLIFISVIFRNSQHFFRPWGRWFARQLNRVTYIFVQNEESAVLLDGIGIHHAEVAGDTRFDRVVQLPEEEFSLPIITEFKGNSKLLMAGSTWQPGEKILLELLNLSNVDFKIVIAPHLINKEHINEILVRFEKYNPILFSKLNSSKINGSRVLIIDSIGMLSHLYRFADIAYVGGGFGVGIHNLLEAATYGIPVIFGPNYKKFREAVELKENSAGFSITSYAECLLIFNKLMNDSILYQNSSAAAVAYVKKNAGATLMISDKIKEYLV